MPNRQKRVLFSCSGFVGLSCALMAAVATGLPFWVHGSVLCRTGAELVNATGPELDKFVGELSFGLFHGQRVKQCGLGGRTARFSCESKCLSSFLVMVLFGSELKVLHLSERISNFNEEKFVFQTFTERYDRSFWLFLLIFFLHGFNIVLIRLAGIQFPFQENKGVDLSGGAADLLY
ncbi:clarin-1 [Austrofundulus limnaeus]|uniref:Clarin-1 n=1 Tax=Austrofundulus limnaeus TaxID=52670 RepID=A0A2I4D2R0_AUSLI|nr:PREDICTED: clarin-1-like [Austrofundulus limnaeus]